MRQAALDVWLGKVRSTVVSNRAGEEEYFLPVFGARYVLSGLDHPDQTWHNDLEALKGQSPIFPCERARSGLRSYMSV